MFDEGYLSFTLISGALRCASLYAPIGSFAVQQPHVSFVEICGFLYKDEDGFFRLERLSSILSARCPHEDYPFRVQVKLQF